MIKRENESTYYKWLLLWWYMNIQKYIKVHNLNEKAEWYIFLDVAYTSAKAVVGSHSKENFTAADHADLRQRRKR